ncbi:bifunctional 23S rRNA (guanine(2069)-N(7))-methyltransferase RlmK/23S rRNA (guanine(2445)-N(2))-methyltransferase RlmL [Endozoicomonas sp. GU-1]|uniref:bifunctional 23S rRNA (guanine(2069)-N(7))-methyltransferase RlmK/23S rRNA (guanine(2445)-N(2))-methyltransferase RlmL n=1 Tax=Endozoicomonas sp. GU-1 TaxID=3009078 RepID=UPI0022B3A675|nr:bifunctional 23S rRNA (guanine(2069)-N(7))-methyltransferase RlmK/23S rRNA (guanine(2445)-N(2))-methyltransferase RlmL [Endozoicomonas sp. GU-1]WBA79893.1 bifunctional 23S rRNA (guanine(2069)-N(7))-methyltransferase RlmK/23S rRNA (guanine(2445)-N(2))-methyltransferase RlmL [Endozoicomonas sp. GU-1]WBA87468.1 bifunctional 23S rRNA (guanine(2069)-N(7))-methyltransferase RlmK/23S rRNA (guanine(2445)-N(2))-methyltransferase RlmL [Endozoicomonas sp. GU-1]
MSTTMLTLFASCPKGVESLLAEELKELGASEVAETVAGVSFAGHLELAYRACLWSRLASRILLRIGEVDASDKHALYQGVQSFDWDEHLDQGSSFRIDFNGSTPDITHTRFGSQLVKDAIVDQLRDRYGWRPSVDNSKPDLRVNVHARSGRAFVAIDLSGQSLHERGYRLEAGEAPLKENLAAAILYRARWPELAKQGSTLLDPMCGSGTFLIEGAMMAADIAPGLLRARFGFDKWMGHIPKIWLAVLEEARARRTAGLAAINTTIVGYEGLPKIVGRARANIQRAGLGKLITVKQQELASLKVDPGIPAGLVIANPPYGERMGDEASLVYLYKHLGEKIKQQTPGWQAAIFTSSQALVRSLGMGPKKSYTLFNGALSCKLFLYDVRERQADQPASGQSRVDSGANTLFKASTAGGEMFANRLKKNLKQLGKWARKENVDCYRLYDADMPEYAVAVDLYRDWVHVQEYAAPKSIDETKAHQRLLEALEVIPGVLGIPDSHVVFKRRERQSGKRQYEKLEQSGDMLEVKEGDCRLLVNLRDYLDTGLFLDHRKMRLRIAREAAGKDFLNLFCYTGTATVHAAVAGAASTTSVDLSNTYLGWARKNLALNGLVDRKHRLEQADCLQWLKQDTRNYDLIFMDPPTFSNSKRLRGVFDVQEAHVELIERAMARLKPGGVLYFSNNFRRFQLAKELVQKFRVEEITATTIDRDFQRRPGIHRCWCIQR